MRRLFISDLHLAPQGADTTSGLNRAFRRWCVTQACEADEVWILGDLFEYWLGDDIGMALYGPELEALGVLAENTALHFISGNRDFLCGKVFAAQTGISIHEEPVLLKGRGQARIALMHGDLLCTEDHAYQRYRAIVHQRWLQWIFLHVPAQYRERIGQRIRQNSQQRQSTESTQEIGDASPQAANALLKKYRAEYLIHGHTHRPARHQHSHGIRYVLPDWRPGIPRSYGWLEQSHNTFVFRTL